MSSSNFNSSSPAPGDRPALNSDQKATLDALINAASTLHTGNEVLEIAKSLYGTSRVDQASRDRRAEEVTHVGTNGWTGETQGFQALARAYVRLNEQGEDAAANKIDEIALGRMVKKDWERNVQRVHRGW